MVPQGSLRTKLFLSTIPRTMLDHNLFIIISDGTRLLSTEDSIVNWRWLSTENSIVKWRLTSTEDSIMNGDGYLLKTAL